MKINPFIAPIHESTSESRVAGRFNAAEKDPQSLQEFVRAASGRIAPTAVVSLGMGIVGEFGKNFAQSYFRNIPIAGLIGDEVFSSAASSTLFREGGFNPQNFCLDLSEGLAARLLVRGGLALFVPASSGIVATTLISIGLMTAVNMGIQMGESYVTSGGKNPFEGRNGYGVLLALLDTTVSMGVGHGRERGTAWVLEKSQKHETLKNWMPAILSSAPVAALVAFTHADSYPWMMHGAEMVGLGKLLTTVKMASLGQWGVMQAAVVTSKLQIALDTKGTINKWHINSADDVMAIAAHGRKLPKQTNLQGMDLSNFHYAGFDFKGAFLPPAERLPKRNIGMRYTGCLLSSEHVAHILHTQGTISGANINRRSLYVRYDQVSYIAKGSSYLSQTAGEMPRQYAPAKEGDLCSYSCSVYYTDADCFHPLSLQGDIQKGDLQVLAQIGDAYVDLRFVNLPKELRGVTLAMKMLSWKQVAQVFAAGGDLRKSQIVGHVETDLALGATKKMPAWDLTEVNFGGSGVRGIDLSDVTADRALLGGLIIDGETKFPRRCEGAVCHGLKLKTEAQLRTLLEGQADLRGVNLTEIPLKVLEKIQGFDWAERDLVLTDAQRKKLVPPPPKVQKPVAAPKASGGGRMDEVTRILLLDPDGDSMTPGAISRMLEAAEAPKRKVRGSPYEKLVAEYAGARIALPNLGPTENWMRIPNPESFRPVWEGKLARYHRTLLYLWCQQVEKSQSAAALAAQYLEHFCANEPAYQDFKKRQEK